VIGDKWNAYLDLLAKDMSEGFVLNLRLVFPFLSQLLPLAMLSMNCSLKDTAAGVWFLPM
jgi:hypothetical protein